uniref:Uncharacterized protein n=1 Tax=Davidia involucrata TaxID=16924 RepID=A0A5B7CDY1_DAVIN
MERVSKVMLLILTVFLVIFTMDVEGAGRSLKGEERVEHPQNFIGGIGGTIPASPGFGGSIPSIPSPGFSFSSFCSLPGVNCVPVQPTIPGGGLLGGGGPVGGGSGSP